MFCLVVFLGILGVAFAPASETTTAAPTPDPTRPCSEFGGHCVRMRDCVDGNTDKGVCPCSHHVCCTENTDTGECDQSTVTCNPALNQCVEACDSRHDGEHPSEVCCPGEVCCIISQNKR